MTQMLIANTTKDEIILEGIIDYAGLYPPASLELDSVIAHWNEYINSEDSWMLGRLIIPANRLEEFQQLASGLFPPESQDPWQLSVLLPPVSTETFSAALADTVSFNQQDCGAVANVVELKATTTDEIDKALSQMDSDLFPFIEIPIDEDPVELLSSLSGSMSGAKVRTGGVTPELYPSSADLARFIHGCATSGLPFKATAGMHHPHRNRNEDVGVDEFGFLSVLASAASAKYKDATLENVEQILTSETADFSMFTNEEIATVRAELFCSFGSCSFDDPRRDLRSIGLLKESS